MSAPIMVTAISAAPQRGDRPWTGASTATSVAPIIPTAISNDWPRIRDLIVFSPCTEVYVLYTLPPIWGFVATA